MQLILKISTADFLLLLQTIILGGTGLIVYLYTKETQRMREAAQFQTSILAEDLNERRKAAEQEKIKEEKSIQPVFAPSGAMFHESEGRATLRFKNIGGTCRELNVETEIPVESSISPRDILSQNQDGAIVLQWVGPEQRKKFLPISVSYTDANSKCQTVHFKWKAGGNLFQENR